MQGCCVCPVHGDDVPEQLECRDVAWCPVYGDDVPEQLECSDVAWCSVYGDDVPEQLECRDVACPVYGEEEQPRRRFTYVVDGEVGRHRRRHRQVEYIVCVSQHRT